MNIYLQFLLTHLGMQILLTTWLQGSYHHTYPTERRKLLFIKVLGIVGYVGTFSIQELIKQPRESCRGKEAGNIIRGKETGVEKDS